jgi:putative ABC transport system permease protein
MPQLINLEMVDLALVVGLTAISIGISLWEQLGLELGLAIATGRSILQLIVLGYILEFIFAINNVWAVLAILAIILTITAIITRNRISQKIPYLLPLVWVVIFISTGFTLLYTNFLIIQPQRWYEPRYIIPLAGILLGNAMNTAIIAGERLVTNIKNSSNEIETHLSLGATPEQAIKSYRKEAIRAAILPGINQMMLVGMVTVPTFTGGQLLAGISPLEAVSYEVLIVLMVSFTNLLSTVLLTQGISRQFFNKAMQLVR